MAAAPHQCLTSTSWWIRVWVFEHMTCLLDSELLPCMTLPAMGRHLAGHLAPQTQSPTVVQQGPMVQCHRHFLPALVGWGICACRHFVPDHPRLIQFRGDQVVHTIVDQLSWPSSHGPTDPWEVIFIPVCFTSMLTFCHGDCLTEEHSLWSVNYGVTAKRLSTLVGWQWNWQTALLPVPSHPMFLYVISVWHKKAVC